LEKESIRICLIETYKLPQEQAQGQAKLVQQMRALHREQEVAQVLQHQLLVLQDPQETLIVLISAGNNAVVLQLPNL